MTNVEKVTDLMEFSKFGGLAQIMVMQALGQFVDNVIEQEEELLANEAKQEAEGKIGFIHMKSWIGVAKEIKDKLK